MEFLRLRTSVAAIALCGVIFAPTEGALPANEYALKSVFLYNFCRFIEWPDSAFKSPNEPLVIGIVGNDPFGPLLLQAVGGETYRNRPIHIGRFRCPADIRSCRLLFVSQSESNRFDQILAAVAQKPVVTVGESENFL